MQNERRINNTREVVTELSGVLKNTLLEPIRVCERMRKELTDFSFPEYQNWHMGYKMLAHARGYLLAYLPVAMPTVVALSIIAQGRVVSGLVFGVGGLIIEGALLQITNPKK